MSQSSLLQAKKTLNQILSFGNVLEWLQFNENDENDLNEDVLDLVRQEMLRDPVANSVELKQGFDNLARYIERVISSRKTTGVVNRAGRPFKIPQTISINNTTDCNAKCTMCPTKFSKRSVRIMPMELFRKIVTDVSPVKDSIAFIYLGLHGEPFVDRHLEEKVEFCTAQGFHNVIITTNGSLLTEERGRRLLAAGLHGIHISLESLKPEVYESIRVGLHHQVVLDNILRFIRMRNDSGAKTTVLIRFIESDANTAEAPSFLEYWGTKLNPLLDGVHRVDLHDWAMGAPETTQAVSGVGNSPCIQAVNLATIHCDGSLALCCLDYNGDYDLGNVSDQHFLQAYNSEKFEAVRLMHQTRQRSHLDRCRTCFLPEFWGGDKGYDGIVKNFNAANIFQARAELPGTAAREPAE